MHDRVDRRRFFAGAAAAAAGVFLQGLAGCRSGHRPSGYTPPPALGPSLQGSLKEHAANARLLFGFALDTRRLRSDAAYRGLIEQQCSIVVAENAMKWHALRPAIDRYDFDDADMLVQFADSRRIKLRGHNLCWHESLPSWFAAEVTQANARQVLRDHIRTVAGRYAGRIHSWDVVNEAIDVKDGRADGLRASPWLRMVGSDYIETAFRVARDADPSALLTYNDYGIEEETAEATQKRAAVLLLLRRLKQRNVPVDAVGIQSHIQAGSASMYGAGLQQFVRSCREMGLEVFVTEMDVNDRRLPSAIDVRDAGVAQQYERYLELLLPDASVTAVLTWGVTDAGTWLNNAEHARSDSLPQRPLLFDVRGHQKPAVAAVCAAFDSRSRSREAPRPEQRKVPRLPKL